MAVGSMYGEEDRSSTIKASRFPPACSKPVHIDQKANIHFRKSHHW